MDLNGDDRNGRILVYDQDLELVDKIHMGSLKDILSHDVERMMISNGYLYMINSSYDGVVAHIEDGALIPVIRRDGLRCSYQYQGEYPVFFVFDTYGNEPIDVYMYNEDSGEYSVYRMDIKDEYHIDTILRNGNNAFVSSFAYFSNPDDVKPDRSYYVSVSDIPDIH